jgi:hypothetical protein
MMIWDSKYETLAMDAFCYQAIGLQPSVAESDIEPAVKKCFFLKGCD